MSLLDFEGLLKARLIEAGVDVLTIEVGSAPTTTVLATADLRDNGDIVLKSPLQSFRKPLDFAKEVMRRESMQTGAPPRSVVRPYTTVRYRGRSLEAIRTSHAKAMMGRAATEEPEPAKEEDDGIPEIVTPRCQEDITSHPLPHAHTAGAPAVLQASALPPAISSGSAPSDGLGDKVDATRKSAALTGTVAGGLPGGKRPASSSKAAAPPRKRSRQVAEDRASCEPSAASGKSAGSRKSATSGKRPRCAEPFASGAAASPAHTGASAIALASPPPSATSAPQQRSAGKPAAIRPVEVQPADTAAAIRPVEVQPADTAAPVLHAAAAAAGAADRSKSLPPGWVEVRHEGKARAYSTYLGPGGERAPSRAVAWRIHLGESPPPAKPPRKGATVASPAVPPPPAPTAAGSVPTAAPHHFSPEPHSGGKGGGCGTDGGGEGGGGGTGVGGKGEGSGTEGDAEGEGGGTAARDASAPPAAAIDAGKKAAPRRERGSLPTSTRPLVGKYAVQMANPNPRPRPPPNPSPRPSSRPSPSPIPNPKPRGLVRGSDDHHRLECP